MMALPVPYLCDSCSTCTTSTTSTSSGSGSAQLYVQAGNPNTLEFLPADQTAAAFCFDSTTALGYFWVPGSLIWVKLKASQEVLECVADPNAEGIVPDDQDSPAFCYATASGIGYEWNTTTKVWE